MEQVLNLDNLNEVHGDVRANMVVATLRSRLATLRCWHAIHPPLSARGLVERGVGEPSLREQVREALAVVERLSASTSSEPPRA